MTRFNNRQISADILSSPTHSQLTRAKIVNKYKGKIIYYINENFLQILLNAYRRLGIFYLKHLLKTDVSNIQTEKKRKIL